MEKLTVGKVKEIAEELRTTREKATGEMAFAYVWKKYRHLFVCYDQFLRCMQICATFFASQGAETDRIRQNTVYKYV